MLLQPYFNNFGKRLIKAPKIYFVDSGLLCYLLGISSVRTLIDSPFVGQIWESFVCGQILRQVWLEPTAATVWYWRDAHGLEVDFLVDAGVRFELIECKWTEHPRPEDVRAIAKLRPVLEAQRPVRARVACRTPSPFPLEGGVDAVSGFEESDWLRSSSGPAEEP